MEVSLNMNSFQNRTHSQFNPKPLGFQQGFSIVEVVLAAALMVIAAVGSALLFNLSSQQTLSSRGKQEQQSAISGDLAKILQMNDRYSCSNGATDCAVSPSDPGESGYYPSGSSNDTTFNNLCVNGGLITNLIAEIQSEVVPTAFTKLGITRQAPVVDSSDLSSHRYTITWFDSSNRKLRQTTLVPTVANWCP